MCDIRVIKGTKNAFINYINALHIFIKNLRGLFLNLYTFFLTINTRE